MTSTPTGAPQTASPSTDAFHAEVLGPFQLDELIGEYNGFAVFSATHQQRQQPVILYLVPAARGEAFPQFQADIEAASKLEHPSIAKVVEFGEIGGIPYVAYENIDGISVQRLTKLERKISPPIACAIVRQAAIGLHHLHENGLLHGAVNPANLLITKSGVVKILSLGVASHTVEQPQRPGATDNAKYVAPEQITSKAETRSDIYALGCTLFFMLTGTSPDSYIQRSRNPQHNQLDDNELGSSLTSVVRAMMELDVTKRVQQLNQVVGTMCNWANEDSLPRLITGHLQSNHRTAQRPTPSTVDIQKASVKGVKSAPSTDSQNKKPIWPTVTALTIGFLGIAAGFLYVGRQNRSAELQTVASATPQTPVASDTTIAQEPLPVAVVADVDPTQPYESTDDPTAPQVETIAQGPEADVQQAPTLETQQDIQTIAQDFETQTPQPLSTIPTSIEVQRPPSDRSADAYHNRLQKQLQEEFGLTNGQWVLTPNEFALISSVVSYGQKVTQDETTENEDFARLVRMQIANKGANPWSSGLYIPEVEGIEKGDRVLVVVWLRTSPASKAEEGKVGIYVESASDHAKEVYLTVKPTPEWRQFLIPFQAKMQQNLRVGFHLAFQEQEIDYGGLTLINFGKTAPFWNAIPAGPKRTSAE